MPIKVIKRDLDKEEQARRKVDEVRSIEINYLRHLASKYPEKAVEILTAIRPKISFDNAHITLDNI